MDLQKLVDAMGEAGRTQRSNYHLTLGGLIAELEKAKPDAPVIFDSGEHPGSPLSYRGYYSDLAFRLTDKPVTVAVMRAWAKAALGTSFEGYKGGDFLMEADTPLWASNYGTNSGRAIISVSIEGNGVILMTKEID